MQINVSVNGNRDVLLVLQGMSSRMGNLKPAMRKIGDLVKNSSKGNFKAQSAPDGTPWKPLSPVTIALRRAGKNKGASDQILLDTGVLRNSITVEKVTDSSVTVSSRLKYSAIHQFGGKAGRGRKVTIPARPYIGIKPGEERDIADILRSHVLRGNIGDGA